MAKAAQIKPEELAARYYADRLILEQLSEIDEVFKPSEVAERLSDHGLGLAAVRSLLASNPEKFAYNERRWVPAARVEGDGRPFSEIVRLVTEKFGAPMQMAVLAKEVSRISGRDEHETELAIEALGEIADEYLITKSGEIVSASCVFVATDESIEQTCTSNSIEESEIAEVEKALGKFDWAQQDAIIYALEKTAPVSIKGLSGAAWKQLSPQDPYARHLFNWREFAAELLAIPGFICSADGKICAEGDAKGWVKTAVKAASKFIPTIEVEDVAPLELKKDATEKMIKVVLKGDDAVTATSLLENQFEITPTVKTFPDDMATVMQALKDEKRLEWVGGDRFMKAGSTPDYIHDIPEPFKYVPTEHLQEDGDPVDCELNDEGLSSSLRKLIVHPLATDVMDEDILPAPRTMPDNLRLVLKPVHRELGTFPLCQFPTGWFEEAPEGQELRFVDPAGNDLQVWLSHKSRLIYGLFDWWLDQPVESGSVFSLTKTEEANVFEFKWLDQTDPVVYISTQRMEELREVAADSEEKSTFELLREVMAHWPKGADFLTILWEMNVVRRTGRRLLASLLSGYICFYQRSGSPVWHYDHKKVDQGFDKSKKKFVH